MRQAVRVQITAEQYQLLRNLLGLTYNQHVLRQPENAPLDSLRKYLDEEMETDKECASRRIAAARAKYTDSDCDIDVDDDAAFSETDNGVWVSGWLWVTYEEAGESCHDTEEDDDEKETEAPARPTDLAGGSDQKGTSG